MVHPGSHGVQDPGPTPPADLNLHGLMVRPGSRPFPGLSLEAQNPFQRVVLDQDCGPAVSVLHVSATISSESLSRKMVSCKPVDEFLLLSVAATQSLFEDGASLLVLIEMI